MYQFIVDSIIGRAFKAMDGYKSYLLAAASICTGVIGMIGHYCPELGYSGMDLEKCLACFALAWKCVADKSAIVKSGVQ